MEKRTAHQLVNAKCDTPLILLSALGCLLCLPDSEALMSEALA